MGVWARSFDDGLGVVMKKYNIPVAPLCPSLKRKYAPYSSFLMVRMLGQCSACKCAMSSVRWRNVSGHRLQLQCHDRMLTVFKASVIEVEYDVNMRGRGSWVVIQNVAFEFREERLSRLYHTKLPASQKEIARTQR